MGATWANDFPRQANGFGQASGDHASSRTDPDDAERLTGIYGSEGWGFRVSLSESLGEVSGQDRPRCLESYAGRRSVAAHAAAGVRAGAGMSICVPPDVLPGRRQLWLAARRVAEVGWSAVQVRAGVRRVVRPDRTQSRSSCHWRAINQGDPGSVTVTTGYPNPQASARDGHGRYTFQAGHEGSIPFARSSAPPQVRACFATLPNKRARHESTLRATCVPDPPAHTSTATHSLLRHHTPAPVDAISRIR